MQRTIAAVLVGWCLCLGAGLAAQQPPNAATIPEELEPRTIGTKGTTIVGFGGYLDRVYSSERLLPMNYTLDIDIGRFLTRRFLVRGGLSGSGSSGGDDAEDRPVGVGAPALHARAGLFYYFTPGSMWSAYGGAEYWMTLTQRQDDDRGSAMGALGLQGAISSRVSLFLEGGYGVGLTGPDEPTTRLVGRVGVRLKF